MMPRDGSGWAATDEAPHRSTGGRWCEVWGFAGSDGTGTGVLTTFGVVPADGRAWYLAVLVRPGRSVAYVGDDEIVRRDDRLSLRRPGLWADHICEEPFGQWTVVNEAYAVELDQPGDALSHALGDPRGTMTALAFDLEWYAAGPAEPVWPAVEAGRFGYQQRGEIEGVVEVPGRADLLLGASASHPPVGRPRGAAGRSRSGARAGVGLGARRAGCRHPGRLAATGRRARCRASPHVGGVAARAAPRCFLTSRATGSRESRTMTIAAISMFRRMKPTWPRK